MTRHHDSLVRSLMFGGTLACGLLVRAASSLLTAALAGAGIVALATWGAACLTLAVTAPAQAQVPAVSQPDGTTSSSASTRSTPPGGPRITLADPTRPPVSASADTGVSTARTTSITPRAAEPAKAAPPATPLPHLQALLVPHTGKASALIDGQVLRVGEAVREWTVQSIRSDGVLLARAAAVAAPAGSGKPAKPAFAPVPTLWLSLLPPLASNVPSRP